jgi:integrase
VGSIIHKATGSLKMAQEQLGYSNVGTTGDIYVHTDDEQVNRIAEILENALSEICGKSVVNATFVKGSVQ